VENPPVVRSTSCSVPGRRSYPSRVQRATNRAIVNRGPTSINNIGRSSSRVALLSRRWGLFVCLTTATCVVAQTGGDRYPFVRNRKVGFIDSRGSEVIAPQFFSRRRTWRLGRSPGTTQYVRMGCFENGFAVDFMRFESGECSESQHAEYDPWSATCHVVPARICWRRPA
jgi:hypothetical protein